MQMRRAQIKFFQTLAVGGPIAATAAHGRADGDGHAHLLIIHGPEFGRVIDELICGQGDEISEHDLGHRAQAAQRQTIGHAHDGGFADGRRPHPFWKSGGKPFGDLERAAVGIQNVFAQHDDPGIIGHHLMQGLLQGSQVGGGTSHAAPSFPASSAKIRARVSVNRRSMASSMALRRCGGSVSPSRIRGSCWRCRSISTGSR